MRLIIGVLLLLTLALQPTLSAWAQPKDQQLVGQADLAYRTSGAKSAALDLYKRALSVNPNNLKANYMAGICYLQTIQKERSLPHFLRVQDLNPAYEANMNIGRELYPDLDYLIGQAYHLGENFDRAKAYYKQFATVVQSGKGSRAVRENKTLAMRTLERRLFECETGKQMKANPVAVRIMPLTGANSVYPDYAPTLDSSENQVIFTSRRPKENTSEVASDYLSFEDVFVATRKDSGWGKAERLEGLNTVGHEATVSQTADGKTLLLYTDANGGDLYIARSKDGVWTKPRPISGEVNSPFRESSGYISKDGKRLYFSSDRPGGYGGTDIYVSALLSENKWGTPSNLGAIINSEQDDESPVFSIDGIYLFYSSKGHRGMGGYDIFRTYYQPEKQSWAKPENLGYPINTADNDLYYVQGNDNGHAYMASSRETGNGDLDLYLIRPLLDQDSLLIRGPKAPETLALTKPLSDERTNLLADSVTKGKQNTQNLPDINQATLAQEYTGSSGQPKQTPATTLSLHISVLDKKSKRMLEVTIRFEDTETGEVFQAKKLKPGLYEVTVPTDKDRSFTVSAEKAGFQFRNATLRASAGESGTRVLDRLLIMETLVQNRPRILKNLYFDFDKINLRPASKLELDLLQNTLTDNPRLIIEVAGHTDYLGTEAYNQLLSERRANAVVSYLAGQGIDRSRLRAKGYGKRIPIASNDDEHEGRELNRRTEFEIISGRVE